MGPTTQNYLCAFSLSAYLLFYDQRESVSALGLELRFGVETTEDAQQGSDQSSLSRLVVRPEPRPVVTVEVCIKHN